MTDTPSALSPVITAYDMGSGVTAFSTTRHGGCSTGLYASLNVNPYCGDDPHHVARNRAALCRHLGIAPDRLLLPHQTHQTRVACIDSHFMSLPADAQQAALEGVDALMTSLEGLCIGVSTADCIPVLLYDPVRRAVAAIHAGWRGTVQRIVRHAVHTMAQTYGTRPADIVAQIGPGIGMERFEVGQEVYDAFAQAGFDMDRISRRYDKWHIDLPLCNSMQLAEAGVAQGHIARSAACTFEQHHTYFSARRLGTASGRMLTAIMLEHGQ